MQADERGGSVCVSGGGFNDRDEPEKFSSSHRRLVNTFIRVGVKE